MTLISRISSLITGIGTDIKALYTRSVPAGGTTGQVLKKVSATHYDVSWQNESGGSGGVSIQEATLSIPAKTKGRRTINVLDTNITDTNKILIQGTLAGEENEDDEKEVQIIGAKANNGSFDVTIETLGFVFGEFKIYYIIS